MMCLFLTCLPDLILVFLLIVNCFQTQHCLYTYFLFPVYLLPTTLNGAVVYYRQVAQHKGLIKVDCIKVKHAYTKTDARVKNFQMKNRQSMFAKASIFFLGGGGV